MKRIILPILSVGAILIVVILTVSAFIQGNEKSAVNTPLQESSTLIYGWGKNDDSQYGPADVKGGAFPDDVTELSAGKSHTLALRSDGTVLSWGSNEFGQLGRITKKIFDAEAVAIPYLTDVIHISAKAHYSLALKRDGTIWSWGNNFTGALGTGDNENRSIPTRVEGIDGATSISAGNKFALALRSDGTVWGWGASCNDANKSRTAELLNMFGSSLKQIDGGYYDTNSTGEGSVDQREDCLNENVVGIKSTVARKLSDELTGAVQVSAGYGHGLILKKDGSVWSFGCNLYGQLGARHFDNKTPNSVPRKITTLPEISSISAGFRHSMVLTKEGKVYAWGIDSVVDSEGVKSKSNVPLLMELPEKIMAIKDGHDYSLFVGESGALWGSGMDNFNFFETGMPKFHTTPQQLLAGPVPVNTIGAGAAHILAVKRK